MFHFKFHVSLFKTLMKRFHAPTVFLNRSHSVFESLPQCFCFSPTVFLRMVSVSAMLVYTRQKNIAQVFILERYFFVSIYLAAIPGTYLAVFLVAALLLCL